VDNVDKGSKSVFSPFRIGDKFLEKKRNKEHKGIIIKIMK
jgi:hypothetical protein